MSTKCEQCWGAGGGLRVWCMEAHNVVRCVGVGDVCNLFDLSENEVMSKVREWSGVWEEGRGKGAEERGGGGNLEMI